MPFHNAIEFSKSLILNPVSSLYDPRFPIYLAQKKRLGGLLLRMRTAQPPLGAPHPHAQPCSVHVRTSL